MERVLRLIRVAITGTISSGKSTVLSILRSLGAYTVDADQLLHTAFSKDDSLRKQIFDLFGPKAMLKDGSVDRAYVSEQIAHQNDLALQLEELCHPYLLHSLDKLYTELLHTPGPKRLFVAEVPLLFESRTKFTDWFDIISVIESPISLCQERYLKGHNRSEEQFNWRLARQVPGEEKRKRADYVIENTGSLDDLKKQTLLFFDWSISTA